MDTLYFRSYSPPSYTEVNEDVFDLGDLVIFVPEETKQLYLNSPVWQKYSAFIQGFHYDDLPDYDISSDYSHDCPTDSLPTGRMPR